MKAARIVDIKKPLQIIELPLPKAAHSEVIVKVRAAGLCRSDIHLRAGGYDLGGGKFLRRDL